ncbi:MAG: putative ABC transporter permease [Clostridia bacterium]|nr:putative ABC transporter permease [Clostridia bacterium]
MENKFSLKQILWYFTFFSIIGLIVETLFCYITTGVLESRKGLIWGPFCPVYGVGATFLILILNKYKDNSLKLFFIGSILGNVIEYLLSFLLEAYYGTRFWDYSYLNWNLNGRICILYSIYWGILSFVLVKWIKKPIDKIIKKIPNSKILHIAVLLFFIIDGLATIWAITVYQKRIEYYNVENNIKENFIEKTLFSNEIMVKTFPNLRYIEADGTEKYIKDIINAN